MSVNTFSAIFRWSRAGEMFVVKHKLVRYIRPGDDYRL